MEILALVVTAGTAAVAVLALGTLLAGYARIPSLRHVPPGGGSRAPRVSVIVAARNEERHVDAAVRGMLAQAYPAMELIVVDDRSTDATPAILARLAAAHPALTVVRVDALPPDWLGKNHALQRGAERATGSLLLFADGDVILAPDALARSVRFLEADRADHLAVAPDMVTPTWPLAVVVHYFMMWLLLYLRPWNAPRRTSGAYIGIGAFNLVRAAAFHAVGGFTRIPLRPDDDLMLGKLLKRAGFRQRFATAEGLIRVEWYASLREMARGFRKNAFAGLRYSLPFVLGAVAGNLVLAVWPFLAIPFLHGPARWLALTAAGAQLAAYGLPMLLRRERRWTIPLYPIAALLFVVILCAAVARTLRRGGIEWRDTFYPLDALRANRV